MYEKDVKILPKYFAYSDCSLQDHEGTSIMIAIMSHIIKT